MKVLALQFGCNKTTLRDILAFKTLKFPRGKSPMSPFVPCKILSFVVNLRRTKSTRYIKLKFLSRANRAVPFQYLELIFFVARSSANEANIVNKDSSIDGFLIPKGYAMYAFWKDN